MVDLDELERLHKAVTSGSWEFPNCPCDDWWAENYPQDAAFIAAIKSACDDGLLERLRHAEMQKPYIYVGRDGKAIKARDLEDQRDVAIAHAEAAETKLAEADSLVLLTMMRAEAAETSLAALKAENERLREALVAMRTVMDTGPRPRKLDEALSWRECDERARALCDAALETTND